MRSQARETVFYLVFEAQFQKQECNYAELFQTAQDIGVVKYDEYTEKVFFGVMSELELIDKKIEENSKLDEKEKGLFRKTLQKISNTLYKNK